MVSSRSARCCLAACGSTGNGSVPATREVQLLHDIRNEDFCHVSLDQLLEVVNHGLADQRLSTSVASAQLHAPSSAMLAVDKPTPRGQHPPACRWDRSPRPHTSRFRRITRTNRQRRPQAPLIRIRRARKRRRNKKSAGIPALFSFATSILCAPEGMSCLTPVVRFSRTCRVVSLRLSDSHSSCRESGAPRSAAPRRE